MCDDFLKSSSSPTIVIRHRKENLKKCSLRGLEKRHDFQFFSYPFEKVPIFLHSHVLLTMESDAVLSKRDASAGLIILDATWRYAHIMENNMPMLATVQKRALPKKIVTAYPRKQTACPDAVFGLASIEAVACAFAILGKPFIHLLDGYYWKESFLEKNRTFLLQCIHGKPHY
jgi:pre-rRNA-processing protein TSR3